MLFIEGLPGGRPPDRQKVIALSQGSEQWRTADITSLFAENFVSSVFGPSYGRAPPDHVRQLDDLLPTVAVIFNRRVDSSHSPQGFVLLRLSINGWRIVWDSRQTADITKLSHTEIEFVGDGIDTLHLTGSSWFLNDDKSKTFGESNSGPHRWFEQVWVRNGYAYSMQSEKIVPSAYNTLVDFVYALRTGDDMAAQRLVTAPSVVDGARRLGLDKPFVPESPGGWSGWCQDKNPSPKHPRPLVPPCHVDTGHGSFVVDMVPNGEDWLISNIRRE